jgi:hypothetical protein
LSCARERQKHRSKNEQKNEAKARFPHAKENSRNELETRRDSAPLI